MQKPLFETVFDELRDQFVGRESKKLCEADEQVDIETGRAEVVSYFMGISSKIRKVKGMITELKNTMPSAAPVLMPFEKDLDKAAINVGKILVEVKAAPANAQMAKALEIVKSNLIPHVDAVVKSITDEIKQHTGKEVSEGVAEIGEWGKDVFTKMMNAVFGDLDAIDVAIKEMGV